jgi:type I restriction enzyme S subunit
MKLCELCEINMGQSPKSEYYNTDGQGLPFLQGNRTFGAKYPTFDTYTTLATKIAEAGDVIISVRAPVGDVNITPVRMCLGRGVCSLRHKEGEQEFLYYLMRYYADELINRESGTVFGSVNHSDIKNLEIEVPPLSEQFEIGRTLRAFDDKIDNNATSNHHLEQMAQAIFISWFVDFEPWGGEQPSDWRIIEFSSFLTPRIEKSNAPAIPLFSVTDTGIYPRGEKFNKNLSKADTKNKIARETDIVFGMSREILNWGIMRSPIGGVSSAYNVFAVDNKINSKYLESFINVHSSYFKDLIRPATREGQGVDKDALMVKSICLPPDGVLAEYYAIEDALTAKIRVNIEESTRLATLRDTLLPRLMSGELSVSGIVPVK